MPLFLVFVVEGVAIFCPGTVIRPYPNPGGLARRWRTLHWIPAVPPPQHKELSNAARLSPTLRNSFARNIYPRYKPIVVHVVVKKRVGRGQGAALKLGGGRNAALICV